MSVKRTIDIHDANDKVLEMYKRDRGIGYGTLINGLIHSVCLCPEKVRLEILSFTKQRLHLLYRQMDQADKFEAAQLMEKAQAYRDIARYLNEGRDVDLDLVNSEPIMIRVEMKDAYIMIPDDWIILNREEAEKCEYACVVEVRQQKKTKKIPHFVYFHNIESADLYDKEFCEMVNSKCAKVYPEFHDFIEWENRHPNREVKLDPENPENLIYDEEYFSGPQIGHFQVYVQGDRTYGHYEPPYGVQIVRTKEKKS